MAIAPELLDVAPDVGIRPMTEADVAEVFAVERASYQFPWSEGIFRDCLRVGYVCRVVTLSRQVMDAARAQLGNLPPTAQRPVIVTDGEIRRFVKKILDYAIPDITVLSYDQLTPQINLQPLGTISPVQAQKQIASA